MDIKIGVSTAIRFWNPKKIFAIAHELKIGIELAPLRWHTVKYVQRLERRFFETRLLSVHPPFFKTYSDYLEAIFRKGQPLIERFLLGLWAIILGTSKDNPAVEIGKFNHCKINFHPKSFIPFLDHSLIENTLPHEMLIKPKEIKKMARKYNAGTTFDTTHAAKTCFSEEDFMDFFITMDPDAVHFSDGHYGGRNEHLIPGDGELPLAKLLQAIKERGKDINIIIELSPYYKNPEEAIKKTLSFIKKNL